MRRLRQWLSAVVLVALVVALVLRRDDLVAAFDEIRLLDPAWVLALTALIAAGIVADGVYTRSVTPQLTLTRAVMVQQAATASNNTVIGSGPVATGLRIAMMRSWGIGDTTIGVGIVALNVIAAYRLWLIALATAVAGMNGADGGVLDRRAYQAVVVVAVVVLSGSTLLWWLLLRHPGIATRLAGLAQRLWHRLRRRVTRLPEIDLVAFTAHSHDEALELLQLHRWRILAAVVVDQAITIAKPLAVVRAFGIGPGEISTWQVLIAYGLVRLVVALTPVPGGIGVTELGLAVLLVRFGGPETVVLAAVLTYRVLTFVLPVLIGGICLVAWRREQRHEAAGRPGPARSPDVTAHGPDDTGGERGHHPEQDRDRDLWDVTAPVVLEHPGPGGRHVDPLRHQCRCGAEQREGSGQGERGGDGRGRVLKQRPERHAREDVQEHVERVADDRADAEIGVQLASRRRRHRDTCSGDDAADDRAGDPQCE